MMNPSRIAVLAGIAAIAGCRSPSTDPVFDPDAGGFDASIEDDAGTGPLCPPGSPDPFNNAYSPFEGGEESADLVVVDFSFVYCEHCAQFAVMWKQICDSRPEIRARVRLYYHHFPIWEDEQSWTAQASLVAVANQGNEAFWQLHHFLYAKLHNEEIGMSPASIRTYADEVLHLDMAQFDADVADEGTMAFVAWDKAQGDAAGVNGTPSVFVCGEKIPWNSLEEVIDGYLAE